MLVAVLGRRDLHRLFGDQRAVAIVEDMDELVAPDLDQDVLFGIDMERRRRIGRRHEDEALQIAVVAGLLAGRGLRRIDEGLQHRGIVGIMLDTLDHHPGIGLLDAPDHLGRRHVDGRDVFRLLARQQLARIIFDAVARHRLRELDQALEREQRMIGQPMLQRERRLEEFLARDIRHRC